MVYSQSAHDLWLAHGVGDDEVISTKKTIEICIVHDAHVTMTTTTAAYVIRSIIYAGDVLSACDYISFCIVLF